MSLSYTYACQYETAIILLFAICSSLNRQSYKQVKVCGIKLHKNDNTAITHAAPQLENILAKKHQISLKSLFLVRFAKFSDDRLSYHNLCCYKL